MVRQWGLAVLEQRFLEITGGGYAAGPQPPMAPPAGGPGFPPAGAAPSPMPPPIPSAAPKDGKGNIFD